MSSLTVAMLWISVGGAAPAAANPSPRQVHTWLEQLGDASFEVREQAVKQLYAAGPAVLDRLSTVTAGDDFEAALRARSIIERIQKLFLVGARVRLTTSQKRLRWDEPLSLRLTIVNPSEFPIHLPFLIHDRQSIDRDRLAVQMGSLLDAADFLQLSGPDGSAVEVTVDDFRGHPQLEDALDVRVEAQPASLLGPGEEFVLTVDELNRGLARYRMLQSGEYRLRFVYVPEWDDERMRRDRVGEVRSNEVTLNVVEAAPPDVLRAGGPLDVTVTRRGDVLVANLTCTHDRPMGVNLNLGAKGLSDHAHLEWIWQAGRGARVIRSVNATPAFDGGKLRRLKPGEVVELDRVAVDELRDSARRFASEDQSSDLSPQPSIRVTVRYANLFNRATVYRRLQQDRNDRRRLEALIEATPLPTFVGTRSSAPLEIELAAPPVRGD